MLDKQNKGNQFVSNWLPLFFKKHVDIDLYPKINISNYFITLISAACFNSTRREASGDCGFQII